MQGTRRSTRSSIKKEQNGLDITSSDATTEAATEAVTSSSATLRTRKSVTRRKTYAGESAPSQIDYKVVVDEDNIKDSRHHRNLPLTLTTNTSSLAPNPVADTSSVNSSYNSLCLQTSKTFVNEQSRRNSEYAATRHSVSRSSSRFGHGEDVSNAEMSTFADNIYEEEESYNRRNIQEYRRQFNCRQITSPTECGGCFGVTALLLLSPLMICFLQWCCLTNDTARQFASMEFNFMSFVADIFYVPAFGAYLTFVFAVFSLSIVLPGRYVRVANGPSYKFAALPVALVFLILFAVAEYNAYPVAEFIIQHYGRFGIYGVLISYVAAIWVHVRSHIVHDKDSIQINEYGKTGNIIIDYALGRQVNPKLMGLVEYKEIFYRVSLISTLMYTMSLIYETVHGSLLLNARNKNNLDILWSFVEQTKYDKVSLISNCMLLLYVMDAIVFEHHLTFSFELQGEGLGCLLLLRYALTPYLLSAPSTYFFSNRFEVKSSFVIYVAVALFSFGLLLKRGSNSLKYKYRFNPNRKIFHNVQAIHTFQGRRLLLHSMWGVVRQPNYLGDILALLAMNVLLMVHFRLAPCMSISLLIILLIHRCRRVNARNLARYHSSWVQYCSKVPYYLIPHVY